MDLVEKLHKMFMDEMARIIHDMNATSSAIVEDLDEPDAEGIAALIGAEFRSEAHHVAGKWMPAQDAGVVYWYTSFGTYLFEFD